MKYSSGQANFSSSSTYMFFAFQLCVASWLDARMAPYQQASLIFETPDRCIVKQWSTYKQ